MQPRWFAYFLFNYRQGANIPLITKKNDNKYLF